jgi:hydroxyacylglutathione hydrolase
MIEKINLLVANSYLIRTEKPILVDTGAPNNAKSLLKRLKRLGINPKDIALILLTHAHSDHAGSAKALREYTDAPVAVHEDDVVMLQRGQNGVMLPVGMEAQFSQPFVDRPFPGMEPDIIISSGHELSHFHLPARILHTPGHSPGSISLVFENGDAIVGDILRGGMMGGMFRSQMPTYPYFLYDMAHKAILHASIRRVLDAGAKRLFVGHGGPLYQQDVETWLDRQT